MAKKYPAEIPYHRKFVSIHHSGPRPQWCTGGGIHSVINNVVGGQRLLTITAQLTTTTLVVVEVCLLHVRLISALVWHGALHASCVIAEPSATMHIQNYTSIAE